MSGGAPTGETLALRRLSTVTGAHTYSQARLAEDFRARLAAVPGARQMQQVSNFVFERSAIDRRHLELSIEAIDARRDWYRVVNEATESLAARALTQLFDGPPQASDVRASECGALVVVSSSWAGFPSLGRRLQERFGLPVEAPVYDLGGLGCAGPTHAIALASMLLETRACSSVCVVAADAMGTHGQARHHTVAPTMAQVVAHCLASDGAAALVLGLGARDGDLLRFSRARLVSRLWPGSLDQNDFTADAENQPLLSVGKEIRNRIVDEMRALLASCSTDATGEPIVFHPGGAALMRSLADEWPQLAPTIAFSTGVLARHGNVGAASVLLVLEAALAAGYPIGPRLRLCALGPGIVGAVAELDGVAAAAPR